MGNLLAINLGTRYEVASFCQGLLASGLVAADASRATPPERGILGRPGVVAYPQSDGVYSLARVTREWWVRADHGRRLCAWLEAQARSPVECIVYSGHHMANPVADPPQY